MSARLSRKLIKHIFYVNITASSGILHLNQIVYLFKYVFSLHFVKSILEINNFFRLVGLNVIATDNFRSIVLLFLAAIGNLITNVRITTPYHRVKSYSYKASFTTIAILQTTLSNIYFYNNTGNRRTICTYSLELYLAYCDIIHSKQFL